MVKNKLLAVIVVVAVLASVFFGCSKPKVVSQGDKTIAISISSYFCEITDDLTLLNYMNVLKQKGEIDFIIEDGMILKINDIEQSLNSYWMLYTDDAENSNAAWGTIIFEGKSYSSASFGAESLVVKQGCTYIWHYQSF